MNIEQGLRIENENLKRLLEETERERDEALAYGERLRESVEVLMAHSHGVSGLHLNGDIASWGELTEGGRFEEWLLALSEQPPAALAALKAEWQAEALYQCVKSCKLKVLDGPDMYSDAVLSFAKDLHQRAQEAAQPCTYPDCRCPLDLPNKDSPCAIGRNKESGNG